MGFFEELKRRNVIRVGIAYVVGSWLIIQVTETLFPVYGLDDALIRTIVTILVIGLIPALILAWVFERTPEGIKLERDVDRTQSITNKTGHTLDRAIIGVLVLALGYFIWDKFSNQPDATGAVATEERSSVLEDWDNRTVAADRKSIAVLPFTNMSNDPANEPFTMGIHDDLLTHLSRIGSLKTISRTSVLQYRNTTKPIPQIAEELGVDHVLEGGIQRSGNRVRINLQLIDATTDEHLWAEIYDRELTAENLFTVQAEIAEEVTGSLKAVILPEEQTALAEAPTQSMAAYDLYLLGRHHQEKRTAESLNLAKDYFKNAIVEDPNYVLAYAGLAESMILLTSYGNVQGGEAYPAAQEAIDKAMTLDSNLAGVWAAKGLLHLNTNDTGQAISALERAIELDMQNYQAWLWYANSLLNERRYPEHLEALQVAYSLEPMSFPVNNNLAGAYNQRGDFVNARQHYERVDQIDDIDPTQWKESIVETYFRGGEIARAVIDARQLLTIDPANEDAMAYLLQAYIAMGDEAEAKRWVDEIAKLDNFDSRGAWLYMAREDFDGALAFIDDKRSLLAQADNTGFPFLLFQAAYLGGQVEAATSYLNEYLGFLGGRAEVNPGNTWQWDMLLVADFLMKHGENSPGGQARGEEMRDQVLAGLNRLSSQGHRHPSTWFGLATARSMAGDRSGALDALEQAIDAGFRDRLRLEYLSALDPIRDDPRFAEASNRMEASLQSDLARLAQTDLAPFQAMAERERVIVPREVLQRYANFYSDGFDVVQVFVTEQGQLMAKPPRIRPLPLVAISQTEFYVEMIQGMTVEFVMDDDGNVTHLLRNVAGDTDRSKVIDAPAPVVKLDSAALQRFTGSWAAQLTEQAEGGTADVDVLVAVISIDQDGIPWIDLDNQTRMEVLPISDHAFRLDGIIDVYTFWTGTDGAGFDRMSRNRDGADLVFERQ